MKGLGFYTEGRRPNVHQAIFARYTGRGCPITKGKQPVRKEGLPIQTRSLAKTRHLKTRPLCWLLLLCSSLLTCQKTAAVTFYVDGPATAASDRNAGTAARPWKTIRRAAGASELRPGDTVLIRSGVYREAVNISVSGTPGKPLTFAAAPGATVVIKGSQIITGDWSQVLGDSHVKEPYPDAFHNVWKIHLDDSYFQGLPTDGRYLSGLFLSDKISLQKIGTDEIRTDTNILSPIGKDLSSIYQNAFYFDKASQTLYMDLDGRPEWNCIETGTLSSPLYASRVHDVTISGLQVRQNRQSNASMGQVDDSQRVVVSDCSFTFSDFQGFGFSRCKKCTIKNSTMSYNGDVGFGFYQCTDCVADRCRFIGNNTRHFNVGWHAGGAKNIPGNTRCTIGNCVAAENDGPGIWFDDGNADCRILHNVVYHNSTGIMYEISPGGATIADNLVFSNKGRGIYISGSRGVIVVHNTVAGNDGGIILMPRGDPYPLLGSLVQNNLLLGNDTAAQSFRGCDLTVFLGLDDGGTRRETTNHSRANLYATGLGMPTVRAEWNNDIALPVWQRKFGEDRGSRAVRFLYKVTGDTFQITDTQASLKRAIATVLPPGLPWKPANPKLIGSSLVVWPKDGL